MGENIEVKMLIHNSKADELLKEYRSRHSALIAAFAGRECKPSDNTAYYSSDTLSRCRIINEMDLRLALADFKTILTEIGRMK